MIAPALSMATLLSAGCVSSAPMRFYTLSEIRPESATSGASAAAALRVVRVKLPAELDRTQLVQRLDANRLHIAEQDRWAAPLEDMIRRVLSADLQSRAQSDHPAMERSAGSAAAARPSAPKTVDLDIDEFIGDSSCAVTLRASWQIRAGANGATLGSGRELIQIPAPAEAKCTIGALPGAMSQALAQLSERIVAADH